jgi:amino-acid N-acetyltransferase
VTAGTLDAPAAAPLRFVRPRAPECRPASLTLRAATVDDAPAIHALLVEHLAEGHLLPRERREIATHAHRFVVVLEGFNVVACAELAPLSRTVAEVRSFVVSREVRSRGVGRQIVDALLAKAEASGFRQICAFTHTPGYFVRLGFSIVPHVWLPEKAAVDCQTCPQFRHCGQYAMVRPLTSAGQASTSLETLHV